LAHGGGGGGDGSSLAGSSSGGDGGSSSSGGDGGGGSDAAAGATSAHATPNMNGASRVGPKLVPLCDLEELQECVHALTVLLRRERTKPPLAAVREKFSEAQRHSVTLLATQNPECRRRGSAAALAAKARLVVDTKLGDLSQAVGRWKSAARSGHVLPANKFEK
jgi:hypothetical protein